MWVDFISIHIKEVVKEKKIEPMLNWSHRLEHRCVVSSLSNPRCFHYPLPVLVKQASLIILKPMVKTRHIMDSPYTHTQEHTNSSLHSHSLDAKHARMVDDLLVAGGQKEERGRASLFLPATKYLSVKDSRLRSIHPLTISPWTHSSCIMLWQSGTLKYTHPSKTHTSLWVCRHKELL